MRNIYKMFIFVFALALTSTIGIAAKPMPTPDQAEQVQDDRLTVLETNNALQQINNSEQQTMIDTVIGDISIIKNQILSLTGQIISLSNRVTNLENSSGISGYEKIMVTFTIPSGNRVDGNVICSQGRRILGGGYYLNFNEGSWDELRIFGSYPIPDGEGWFFSARNTGTTPKNVDVYAICANAH